MLKLVFEMITKQDHLTNHTCNSYKVPGILVSWGGGGGGDNAKRTLFLKEAICRLHKEWTVNVWYSGYHLKIIFFSKQLAKCQFSCSTPQYSCVLVNDFFLAYIVLMNISRHAIC